MKVVTVTVDSKANISIEAKGFQGKGCEDVVSKIEDMLGEAKDRQHTSEFYAEEHHHLVQNQ